MASIAESFGRAGKAKAGLYVALDQSYIFENDFEKVAALAGETGRIMGGLMKYPRSSNIKGPKRKLSAQLKK